MSTLLEETTLLVSRLLYHGGDGLQDMGLRFFRSHEEYKQEAETKGWHEEGSFKSSWCREPVEMKVWVNPEDLVQFKDGNKPLTAAQVFIACDRVTDMHTIGI